MVMNLFLGFGDDQVAELLHLAAAPISSRDEADQLLALHGHPGLGVLMEQHVAHHIPHQLPLLLCKDGSCLFWASGR